MPTSNFGPWTTSLTTGSRLELSAFWRGRLLRLPAVADGRVVSIRKRASTLAPLVLAAALFPMVRPRGASVAAVEAPAVANGPEQNATSDSESIPSRGEAVVEVAFAENAVDESVPGDEHGRALQKAVRDAVAYLSGLQADNGSWSQAEQSPYPIGMTSLAALALNRAGVKSNDLRLRRAAEYLRAPNQKPSITYEVALQTIVLCALDPKRDAELIQRNATWLEEGQLRNGPTPGSWSYGRGGPQGGGDRSNAEFALWGLDAAANAGAKVRRETWESALAHWLREQTADGGWSYSGPAAGNATGSMTAAGVASVAICLSHLTNDERKPTKEEQAAIERGLQWMTKNFAAGHNPGAGSWLLYYAVMFRRAADATRTDRFGDHDWRREFAEYFVSQQNKQTRTWHGNGIEGNPVLGTSLALLALMGADPKPPAK